MFYTLSLLFYLGLIVGFIKGKQELNNSKQIIYHKSAWSYWLGK